MSREKKSTCELIRCCFKDCELVLHFSNPPSKEYDFFNIDILMKKLLTDLADFASARTPRVQPTQDATAIFRFLLGLQGNKG